MLAEATSFDMAEGAETTVPASEQWHQHLRRDSESPSCKPAVRPIEELQATNRAAHPEGCGDKPHRSTTVAATSSRCSDGCMDAQQPLQEADPLPRPPNIGANGWGEDLESVVQNAPTNRQSETLENEEDRPIRR